MIFKVAKEIIIVISAAVVAYVAYRGLSTWKKELHAKSDHETARMVLKANFCVRSAVHGVRNNWISPEEYPQDTNLTVVEKHTHLFKLRWQLLDAALQEFDLAKVEGQALWGKDFERILEPVYEVVNKLNCSIAEYLEKLSCLSPEEQENTLDDSILALKRKIFHIPMFHSHRDTFGGELFRVFKDVEDNLRPKIYRK